MSRTFGTVELVEWRNRRIDRLKPYWKLSDIPPYVVIKLKDMFKQIGQHHSEPFHLPATKEMSTDLEWFLHRYPMKISVSDLKKMHDDKSEFHAYTAKNYELISGDYKPHLNLKLNEGQKLLEYQDIAVAFGWRVNRLLIADEVGLGKTPEGIAMLLKKEWLPGLVVVQSHLPRQWKAEFEKFTGLKVHIIDKGKHYTLPPADVYITKYTIISKWVDVLRNIQLRTMILDEVQEVRRLESAKTEACKAIADQMNNVIGLSGTPIVNYGDEIWNIYNVIKPDLFPDRDTFCREWLAYSRQVKDPKALGTYLRDQFAYLRRTKEDVKMELDPVNKIVHTVDYNKGDIEKMESEARVLALTMMQGSFVEQGQASRELSIMVRKATGISKARSVADYVKVILQNGEKVLLMGWHLDVYAIWEKELADWKPVKYAGSESQKLKAKEQFMTGDSDVLMMSLRAGSAGLDGLQKYCKYIVFGELDWSGVLHEQAIGRLYRKGQEEQVTAIFLVSDSGSDPIVTDIIGLKKAQQDGINDPFADNKQQFSDDSIIKRFAEKLVKKSKNSTKQVAVKGVYKTVKVRKKS